MKALFDSLAAVADGADVILTAVKTVSTTTKALLVAIEMLSINTNSIYKAIEVTCKCLKDEVIDLQLDTGTIFISNQGTSLDMNFHRPSETIAHLRTLSINLEGMYQGCETIQAGMKSTSKSNEILLTSIDVLYEQLKASLKLVKSFSKVKCLHKDMYETAKVLSSDMNFLSDNLDLVENSKNLMHSGFKMIFEGMLFVKYFVQEALEDIKAVFEALESIAAYRHANCT